MQTRYVVPLASEEHWRIPNNYFCTQEVSISSLGCIAKQDFQGIFRKNIVVLTLCVCERPEEHVWESTVLCYIQGTKVIVQQWASGCHLVEAEMWNLICSCFFLWRQVGDLLRFFLCSISEACYWYDPRISWRSLTFKIISFQEISEAK